MDHSARTDSARVLFNASNLHVGGGVQVASSAVSELARMPTLARELEIWASKEVNQNLNELNTPISALASYAVVDSHGMHTLASGLVRRMETFAAVFTVFGPLYIWKLPGINITGFAQPWIIYPDNECYAMLTFRQRLVAKLKYKIQGYFFKRADVLVVELNHVKEGLMRILGIPAERIHVVHNCISSIYLDKTLWKPIKIPIVKGFLRLGFLGRNYLHKNTVIFPSIVSALERLHGMRARFYVTFTEKEWAECTPDFRDACINVGPLSAAQCPQFYEALDAVVFPSLLECFSATPLEAMVMQRTLFASDRPFNRDICGVHAHYFDPLDATTAAASIAKVFSGSGPDPMALLSARKYAINFSSPKERAEKYLAILKKSLSEKSSQP